MNGEISQIVVEIGESDFSQEVLLSDKLVLVDFWADWCGPCKMLGPVIEELANEYKGVVKVVKINTDKNSSLSSKFQITSIPCLIFFKNGVAVRKIVGFKPKSDIKKIIESIL
ncbi:MAG: thioredoxin [Endomicrobium sp.]|jgi:thioredoxin 1|nr:thioredoxin [Endomicrobium sp.]